MVKEVWGNGSERIVGRLLRMIEEGIGDVDDRPDPPPMRPGAGV